ncbi:MAG TPA: CapA family protein [Actinomycetota bacterium]
MRRCLLALALLGACASPASTPAEGPAAGGSTVRLLFAGDVMLGRGVAEIAVSEPAGPLAGVRWPVASADLAIANLESPLTARPHDPGSGSNALEAAPSAASWLRAAGLDALAVANNHAGDAGPRTVSDTVDALSEEGLPAIGAGADAADAFSARMVDVAGLRVALLAFDATGQGPRAGTSTPGIAWWDEDRALAAVTRARASAEVVAVALHGGLEYVPAPDPYLLRAARALARAGADVVWGHGPHVIQPVRTIDPDGDGRPTVVATSLGNLLFDQHAPGTRRGALLEVLAGSDGVRAYRVGTAEHRKGPAAFRGWRQPRGDAVALEGRWWTLVGGVEPEPTRRSGDVAGFEGDVVDAALGDPDLDGRPDLVVSFRRPYRAAEVSLPLPRRSLVDILGRSAHVGLYRPDDLRPRWVAGTLARPVAALAPCDGLLAVAYSTLNGSDVVAAGAWRWGGFGFVSLPDLRGPGFPGCADVDLDGRSDALVLGRSPR